jgi:phage anti-repressor protein
MFDYGFTENEDYQSFNKNIQMSNEGINQVFEDYGLTFDTAK